MVADRSWRVDELFATVTRAYPFRELTRPVLGSVLGLILGTTVNRGHLIPIDPSIYFIDHLPVLTNPLDAVAVVGASLLIATLAPLYPSIQAAE